jgi:long-chain fatty acid transport protein
MAGLGLAYRPTLDWLLVADVRTVFWQDVMDSFTMRFQASGAATNGPFAGQVMNATLFQRWDDQVILQLGAAVRVTKQLTLRFGGNYCQQPDPGQVLELPFSRDDRNAT